MWKWECPYDDCDAKCRKIKSYCWQRKAGKKHLRRSHNDYDSDPVMIKVEMVKVVKYEK